LYSDSVLPETSSIRSLFLTGPAGRLEALLNAGSPTATHAAVVCHPHPLYGGTLHNKVVFHAMKALNGFGFPVLRFNFRSTGLSEGEHASGLGEVEDVRAALDWLEREFTVPVIFAGFSFGAAVGLRTAYADDRVSALIALGLPQSPSQIELKTASTISNSCASASSPNSSSAARAISSVPPESSKRSLTLSPTPRNWSALTPEITSSKEDSRRCASRSKIGSARPCSQEPPATNREQ
jgi:alpha/beta superfamily hydrolase